MVQCIDELLSTWTDKPVDGMYFRGDTRFKLQLSDYSTFAVDTASGYVPTSVHIKPNFTRYGIMLSVHKKGKKEDIAFLGFNIEDEVIDCLQIQGGKGFYRELCPIRWDGALLGSLVALAKEGQSKAVCVIPHFAVAGQEPFNVERLQMRYSINASNHGFNYDGDLQRYVLRLNDCPKIKVPEPEVQLQMAWAQ